MGRGKVEAHSAISFLRFLISSTSPEATLALKSLSLLFSLGRSAWTDLQSLTAESM